MVLRKLVISLFQFSPFLSVKGWGLLALALQSTLILDLSLNLSAMFGTNQVFIQSLFGGLSLYCVAVLFYKSFRLELRARAAQNRVRNSMNWARKFISGQLSDIRRPLQGLIGVRDVYDFNFDNPDTEEYMEIVNHCSEHVVKLINRLQLYSELQGDRKNLRQVRFTLTNVLEDSLKLVEASNPGKKIRLDQQISPKVLRDYYGSYDLIRALLVEVLDNAIRYSPKANIELSADTSYLEDYNLIVRVEDRGPGFSNKDIEKMSLELSMASDIGRVSSKGLGIPLIRSLARELNARVDLKSVAGEGSVFEIHLRVPSYSSENRKQKKLDTNQRSNQILVVEDDPLAQKIVCSMLKRLGYRSTIVSNGHDAVELCRRQKFGLILMDLEMPLMNGFEAAKHILDHYRLTDADTMIVALTALSNEDDKQKAKEAGCDLFVMKPINRAKMANIMDEAGIAPHFHPRASYEPAVEASANWDSKGGHAFNFSRFYHHMNSDMSLSQKVINQAIEIIPKNFEALDNALLEHNLEEIRRVLHQLKGEFGILLCEKGSRLCERLESYDHFDSVDFIQELENLNKFSDSLMKELSLVAKHNEALA